MAAEEFNNNSATGNKLRPPIPSGNHLQHGWREGTIKPNSVGAKDLIAVDPSRAARTQLSTQRPIIAVCFLAVFQKELVISGDPDER